MELSGFLLKKSGVFSGQRKRYFVLKEGTLLWYKSERTDACWILSPLVTARPSKSTGAATTAAAARSGLVRRISRHASSSDGSGSGAMPGSAETLRTPAAG